MADASDVEQALAALAANACYPSGTGQPSVLLNSAPAQVYRGWPLEDDLRADMAVGITHVTIFARSGVERNVTAYDREPHLVSVVPPTLTATVVGNQVTIGGTVSVPQNVIVRADSGVVANYAVQGADSLTSVATGLAVALAVPFPGTTNSGPVITVVGSPGAMTTRVATTAAIIRERRRQQKAFQVSLWAPTPELRDSLAKVIDPVFDSPDGSERTAFITLPDGSPAWVMYDQTISFDTAEEENVYRRDLFYTVEYATTFSETVPEVGVVTVGISGADEDTSTVITPPVPHSY